MTDPIRARELLWQFLREYPQILQGARGVNAQRIAVEWEEGKGTVVLALSPSDKKVKKDKKDKKPKKDKTAEEPTIE